VSSWCLPGRSSWTCTSSAQSVGGPRAGETRGGSSGSPRCVRIFRNGPGSVMNEMSRMSPPHLGHSTGNSSPTRAMSLAQAIRKVSRKRSLSRESQQSPVASSPAACPPTAYPPVAASRRLPTFPFVECRDGGPELVIRGENPVIPVAVLPRWRHEGREPIQKIEWREFDDAIYPRPGRFSRAARANPVGRLVSGSTWRTRAMRPSSPRRTESRSSAKGGRAQYRSRCSRPWK
jgi:hypothetical protein